MNSMDDQIAQLFIVNNGLSNNLLKNDTSYASSVKTHNSNHVRLPLNDIKNQEPKSVKNKKKKKRSKKKKSKLSNNNMLQNNNYLKYVTEQRCELCTCNFKTFAEFTAHCRSINHTLRETYRFNKKSFTNTIDRNILIEFNDEGHKSYKIDCDIQSRQQIELTITNNSNTDTYIINEILLLYTKLDNEINLKYDRLPIHLKPKTNCHVNIKYFFTINGRYLLPILFKLKTQNILKEVEFEVHSSSKNLFEIDHLKIIDGVRPDINSSSELRLRQSLSPYYLPDFIIKFLNKGKSAVENMTNREKEKFINLQKLLKVNCLNSHNYCEFMEALVFFEEFQMRADIRAYDCTNQILEYVPEDRKLLSLEVPGLAEDRPSLIKGDDVIVHIPGASEGFRGYIHRVNKTTLYLGFHNRFVTTEHNKNNKYNVSFGFNRHTIRIEHQAIELIKKHKVNKVFFPTLSPSKSLSSYKFMHFECYEQKIENNEQQKQAVRHIVAGTSSPAPYLLFGPPGTGKTMTLVEAILQIFKQNSRSRILVAAPSNSAANEITSRLLRFNVLSKDQLFRMISSSFDYDKVIENIRPYCNRNGDEYYFPPIEILESYRILIVTLAAAAKLVNGGVRENNFTHVFIDESGHSTESEILIPIAGIITSEKKQGRLLGNIVLAGDPQQLGPVIHSKLANYYGFGISMLERLMTQCEIYKKKDGKYNPQYVTKLLKNFRSHPDILRLPNEMFYEEELQAKGTNKVNIAVGWNELNNPNFPLIFHNVRGENRQDLNSPSYYNLEEVEIVIKYLRLLINKKLKDTIITENDVGIVSPYRKQVQKINDECKRNNWQNILIGSVEQFQGQEKLIIIISTVRSKQDFPESGRFLLGFLRNPKRFNVAITRAKALVIVIGNADVLQWDQHWSCFIKYCYEHNALSGEPFLVTELWRKKRNDFQVQLQNNASSSQDDVVQLLMQN